MLTFVSCASLISATIACTIHRSSIDFDGDTNDLARHRRDITSNCGPDDEVPPNRVNTTERLAALRDLMAQHKPEPLTAYIVPMDDEERRTWISGFSGSNGDAIVTMDKAALWTDGRYFLQATEQLDCNWELMRIGQPNVPTYTEWLANLTAGSLVGADPKLMGAKTWLDMRETLDQANVTIVSIVENLIDEIWTEENGRPPFIAKTIVPHSIEYAGKVWPEKVQDLRKTLDKEKVGAMVVSEHDEIAWLFNLRGVGESTVSGLYHSPLFQSMALITADSVHLWMHFDNVVPGLLVHLQPPGCEDTNTCTEVNEYETGITQLNQWSSQFKEKILVTKASTYLTGASFAIYEALPAQQVAFKDSPVLLSKNIKNPVEAEGMVQSHIRDAVALCEFAAHLEEDIEAGVDTWTELSAAALLADYRSKQSLNMGTSFTTISAFGTNAAVIHYSPTNETDTKIDASNVYLVDSGGQYLDGTTDVTRTFHYGTPTDDQVEKYTFVLMGATDLASVSIPSGTSDGAIDLVTRQHLFERGLNYRHGTGHGIGAYLSVHEGPVNIHMSTGTRSHMTGAMKANVFFSDEPGYYEDGQFGIRLETILRVVEKNLTHNALYGEFVRFEAVTLVPFEPKLIDFSRMTVKQLEWYNKYNEEINEKVASILKESGSKRAYEWVMARTQYVSPSVSNEIQKWKNEL